MEINFYAEGIDYHIHKEDKIKSWIAKTVKAEAPTKKIEVINIIFTSDEYLLKLNQEYLQNDYYTDIITFDYNEDKKLSGDLFISVDRVGENSKIYAKTFFNELHRVIIHGILHLLGYEDKTPELESKMRKKEDEYLAKILKE